GEPGGRQGPDAGDAQVPPRQAERPWRRARGARARGQHRGRRQDPARVPAPLGRYRGRAADVRRRLRRADGAVREQVVRRARSPRGVQAEGEETKRVMRAAASSRSSMLRVWAKRTKRAVPFAPKSTPGVAATASFCSRSRLKRLASPPQSAYT